MYEGKKTYVCKVAFQNIHDITRDRIQEHNRKRTSTGVTPDQRGRKTFNNRVTAEQSNLVHEHISQIPSRRSHYTIYRNEFKQYVNTPDKMSQMAFYRLYVEWLEMFHQDQVPVKSSKYCDIFNNCYNLEIVSPKIDVCDTCLNLKNEIQRCNKAGIDYAKYAKQLEDHKSKAELAYSHLKGAEDDTQWNEKEWLILCMDLQKTITLPKCNAGSHYYMSKLNVFNFCIHDVQKKKSFFYVWEEFNGRKGSAEIYSCLYKFLNQHVFHLNGVAVPKDKRPHKLRIICDNCGGQNKSNKIALALLRLVHQELFKRIELAFLVPGHTYMACDRKFGHISKQLKKQAVIGSPEDLIYNINVSQKMIGNVYKLERNDIVNLDVFAKKKIHLIGFV